MKKLVKRHAALLSRLREQESRLGLLNTRYIGAPIRDRAPGDCSGLCRVCGCTEVMACDPPCSWETPTLCTTCAQAIREMAAWLDDALAPFPEKLIEEARIHLKNAYGAPQRPRKALK